MFTGIIETVGEVTNVEQEAGNLYFTITSSISPQLRIDQSVAHEGICMTVTRIVESTHQVCAIAETISKTTCGLWQQGKKINLERCLSLNARLDGHIVQGHVDTRGLCIRRTEGTGSVEFEIEFPPAFAALVIEKGSICVNGISLTCHSLSAHSFCISIIPYTLQHTSISELEPGHEVNLEFDLIGKYLMRRKQLEEGQA
ncbi:MAG: riboflavin synthase [Chitinophagaceae bacterium]|nr:riboflavin synthase [Chitinophagaceae bacterium]